MSLIIAINTASKESAVALIEGKKILGEESWESNANESEKVLPAIQGLLKVASKTWEDLEAVFVVKGPGAYTSLRVGINIANSMAWKLKVPMKRADVFAVWESRIKEENQKEPHLVVIAGGRDKYLLKGDQGPHALEEIEAMKKACYGEVPSDFALKKEVSKSFGEGLVATKLDELEEVQLVEPLYARPPDITKPKPKIRS